LVVGCWLLARTPSMWVILTIGSHHLSTRLQSCFTASSVPTPIDNNIIYSAHDGMVSVIISQHRAIFLVVTQRMPVVFCNTLEGFAKKQNTPGKG